MAGTRKRKHASTEDNSRPQTDIKAFGTLSKSRSEDGGMKKRKTEHEREATPPPKPTIQTAQADKKRKRDIEPDQDENDSAAAKDNFFKRFARRDTTATPQSKRFKDVRPPTPAETPSKDTAALFDKLRLGPNAKAIQFSLNAPRLPETPPRTPEAEELQQDLLPDELQDLISLHAAFLSALSLYYAHNGTSSPVDIKALLTMITKNWKKRAATFDDLRKVLAVDQERPPFLLQDSGRAGVSLIKSQPRGQATKRAASFVDEVDLNASFEDALEAAWTKWKASGSNAKAATFIAQLPLIHITRDASLEKTAPMFARGHQRLAELKAGQAAAKREAAPVPDSPAQVKSTQATQSRGSTLLDRILAKQAHTASLTAGPTKQQLERKAALHRIEDIARVLDLLAAGRARCSFSMPAMVQQLQQSLRNPISREEVERCLNLMAEEVTPGFVGLVKNGTVTGVVITRGGRVGLDELRRRVANATN